MLSIERSMIVIIYVIKSYSLHDATRKETSNISAQDKVGNFFTIIKCHSLQNRPTIFFIFQVNGGKREAWAKGGAFFFGLLPSHVSRLPFSLRACLRSPEKGPSLSYAVVVLRIGWQTWSRVSTVSQQGTLRSYYWEELFGNTAKYNSSASFEWKR